MNNKYDPLDYFRFLHYCLSCERDFLQAFPHFGVCPHCKSEDTMRIERFYELGKEEKAKP